MSRLQSEGKILKAANEKLSFNKERNIKVIYDLSETTKERRLQEA